MSPDARGSRTARAVLQLARRIVPPGQRREWWDEWHAELGALDDARRAGGRSGGRLPRPVPFALGALTHALWMRKEEWTMDGVTQDLRYSVRMLARAPGFAAVAAATLAVGIGANAAVFTLVDGLILRPPPGVSEPDRLVQVARSYEGAPRWDNWSWPAYREIARSGRAFDGVAGYSGRTFHLGEGETAESVPGELVSGTYFETAGVDAALGRLLGPGDDVTPGAHPVVVLSHALWNRRFGGDPAVLGRTVLLAGAPYEVVGVAEPGFAGLETLGPTPAVWVPAAMHPPFRGRLPFDEAGWSWLNVFARLAEGESLASAGASARVVESRLRASHPVHEDIRVLIAEGVGLEPQDREQARTVGVLLAGIAGMVLLLTCANVANLFVARATTRAGEMGVRLALGAGRARLVRQLATESVVLGVLAAALAVPLTAGAARLLPAVFPYPMASAPTVDARVFVALAGLGVLSGLLFGAAPAVFLARRDPVGTLRDQGTTGATHRTRLRDGLVVLQLALSVALLSGAALLGRSVLNARSADPGFDPVGLVTAGLDLEASGRYDRASATRLQTRLRERLGGIPGVGAVSLASQAPFQGPFSRSGRAPLERAGDPDAVFEAEEIHVDEDYFATMGIRLLEGRLLGGPDDEPEPVAVVNQALARMFWPGGSAVGRELTGEEPLRVVGVVEDVRHRGLRARARPAVYRPLHQGRSLWTFVHARSDLPAARLERELRRAVADLDPGLPLNAVGDVHARLAASLGDTGSFGLLVAVFAGVAVVLSVVGLYGLMAYGVSQRVRELGIRMALGAEPSRLVRMVLRRGTGLTVAGLGLGVGMALALGRALEGLLYGVGAGSVSTLAAVGTVLAAVALFAAWLPARRASRVDASVSLRS